MIVTALRAIKKEQLITQSNARMLITLVPFSPSF